ncbi:unnamed protein product [Hermetia illucens]|uniref:Exocyst complex component 8 n=1 Tax=Hermetia illucens TaxID=343691 RepID=A0A7R8V657_HERIL|nr:exocyst complex component 8 [Hermetia illucens]CAD7093646.1 unnamed protein product [Hermetia illucens]
MTETMKEFDRKDFRTDKYVKELVQECVGGSELQQRKSKIHSYYDQTSSALKKHVYANYMQFIETAKEISHLESEMYQLSHILMEQRNLLGKLRDGTGDSKKDLGSDETAEEDADDTQSLVAIKTVKEMVPGFTGSLENKTFLNEGALIELDANDYRPIQRVFFYLFNDILIVCKVKHDKKLEFLTQYDPTKIAVINIKDLDGVRNAINIITPDGSKILQCVTVAAKNEWIEKFEIAFKFNQLNKTKKITASKSKLIERQASSIDTKSITSDALLTPTEETASVSENWAPEWLATASEEIQALIAQRHFEDALSLIQKSEEFLEKDSTFWNSAEIAGKIKNLKTELSNVLIHELSIYQNRNLQATLRSTRRPLKLLGEMGKARQACATFLKVCTSGIRSAQREARRNNLEVSELFFCDLAEVATEFMRAFKSQAACVSCLVVWCNTELRYFASQLVKHYLTKGSQLEAVAKCVEGVRAPCAKLNEIGLDLSYHMEGLLRGTLEQIIEESRVRMLETVGRTEDAWQPYNLQTKSNLKSLLRDMEILGLDMSSQVTGDTWINLTQSTVNFCRHFLSVTESCAYLAKIETLKLNSEILLKDIFLAQHAIKPNPGITVDLNFVSRNKSYLVEELLPVAVKKFEKLSGRKNEVLSDVHLQLRGPPKPKPRSVYQTDVL